MTLTTEQRIERLQKRLIELDLGSSSSGSARPLDLQRSPWALGEPWPTREGVAASRIRRSRCRRTGRSSMRGSTSTSAARGWCASPTRSAEEAFGLDPNHQRFPLKARRFSIRAEASPGCRSVFRIARARLERSPALLIEHELPTSFCTFSS